MRTKHSVPALIVLLCCLILSACSGTLDPVSASASASSSQIGVTPINTSARALIVTINIDEDQDATDRMSNITMQFRTDVIEEDNFVIFHHGEKVTCNGVSIKLNDSQIYTFKVPRKRAGYACSYAGYTKGIGLLTPVQMIGVAARSTLSPQRPSIRGQHYKVSYTPDSSGRTCPITADAIDSSNNPIQGNPSSSDLGVYTGPDTSSLSGAGGIMLKRTCSPTPHNSFHKIILTYQSTASVEVTWSH